ncbi:hypothetical protein [Streptomyces cyaneochromogenes]|uniref:hypothetical protein n=1 Tax=Streptomyces cyaneochromogenes TaxID=2496836 RepID=UPI001589D4B5|nr:hypothetical protein [Streptomyces cyaneochromogenes]
MTEAPNGRVRRCTIAESAATAAGTSAVSFCARTSLSVASGVTVWQAAAFGVVSAQAGSWTSRRRCAQSRP